MVRIAVLAALALAAASPALAFERASAPGPSSSESAGPRFVNFASVARLAPAGANEPFRFGAPQKPTDTVIYDVSKGKTASHIDVNDPRDNPFMEQSERRPAAAR